MPTWLCVQLPSLDALDKEDARGAEEALSTAKTARVLPRFRAADADADAGAGGAAAHASVDAVVGVADAGDANKVGAVLCGRVCASLSMTASCPHRGW